MKLNQLINTKKETEITGITSDSRKVEQGFLFGAVNGDYAADAAARGAAAIIVAQEYAGSLPPEVEVIRSADPVYAYARAVAAFFDNACPSHLAAVTGTNGKTSIADFVRQVLSMMGYKAASIGTLGLIKGDAAPIPSPNTTPDCVSIHQELKELADEGVTYTIMEASSHGLHQGRMAALSFDVAGFTNLTRDHLDYHKTFEDYFNAKMILFRHNLKEGGTAVLNADIECFGRIVAICEQRGQKIISYGFGGQDIKLLSATPLEYGQKLDIEYFGQPKTIEIPLVGEFQAMNVLCALGMLAAMTGLPDDVINYIDKIKGAKGRFELVAHTPNGAAVYIDYAHTPDGLENVLKALRPHTPGRLHVVFGCGGNRDKGKRPLMGKIAHDLADVVYVTDDNPRFEEAEDIRNEIMPACQGAYNIADRAKAIKFAVERLMPGDVLVVAGKGHETGQYIKGKIHHFSDHEEILKNI